MSESMALVGLDVHKSQTVAAVLDAVSGGVRFGGKTWTQQHERWLCTLHFEDPLSQAVFVDYLCAVQALAQRRKTLGGVLEAAVPNSSHAETVGRLRCFRTIDTLTAAGLCAEVGDFTRFEKPALLSGFLGIVPSEYTSAPPCRDPSTQQRAGSTLPLDSRPFI